jgi:CubicO group peptidase (beta-lactamase class C family)/beta-glucosidase-like glycosyl hydrolase
MPRFKVGIFLILVSPFSLAGGNPGMFIDNIKASEWADSLLITMSLEEKIGQLFMMDAYSDRGPAYNDELNGIITKYNIGGLVFFRSLPESEGMLTSRLSRNSRIPLLVGIESGWEELKWDDSLSSPPGPLALGAVCDNRLLYNAGSAAAHRLRLLGVHLNFVFVPDFSGETHRDIAKNRFFSDDSLMAAEKSVAYMQGMQDNGIMVASRNFPIQWIPRSGPKSVSYHPATGGNPQLYIFNKLVSAGLSGMTNAWPEKNSESEIAGRSSERHENLPANIHKITGFDGILFYTAGSHSDLEKSVDEFLSAGADIFLFPYNIQSTVNLVKKAIQTKKVKRSDIDGRVKKFLMMKFQAGLNDFNPIDPTPDTRIKREITDREIYGSVFAENSITLFKNSDSFLPVRDLDTLNFASLTFGSRDNLFQDMLGRYAPFRHYMIDEGQAGTEVFTDLYAQLENHNVIIAGINESLFSDDSQLQHAREALLFLSGLKSHARVVVVLFGSPALLKYFDGFNTLLCVYEDNVFTRTAAPQAIFGSIAVHGRCPVTLNEKWKAGFGLETPALDRLGFASPEQAGFDTEYLKYIDTIAMEAISLGATPGCQVLVAKNGKVVINRSYGYYTWDSTRRIDENSLFDLASITKVAATLQAVMILYERNIIDLDKKISCYLPELRNTNKEDIIIRDLLTHQSGLQPYIPFWKRTIKTESDRIKYYSESAGEYYDQLIIPGIYGSKILADSIWSWIVTSALRKKNDASKPYDYRYSDIGYYILHRMVERMVNQPLDEFLAQNIYDPLGLTTMAYLPGRKFMQDKIVPSSEDRYFRNSTLQGYVQDELAALYGGVAGHAGLFSNAFDLAILMQMHLQKGYYGGTRYFFPSTIDAFTEQQYRTNRRGLGWDKPDHSGNGLNPASAYAAESSFGHSGFTGTMVWADPEHELIFVFLSNRTFPDIENKKLSELEVRKRIQTVIYSSLMKHLNN